MCFVANRSMYFDEDGDLAHEFYVEMHTSRGTVMRREPLERLRPQVGCILVTFLVFISHFNYCTYFKP